MVRFVTIKKFCELTGFSEAAVYTRKSKGVWQEGSVWRYAPDSKKILMDLQAYDAWVESGGPAASADVRSPLVPPLTVTSTRSRRNNGRSPTLPKLVR